ncbi:MAG: hypothetical protein SCM57_13305, partial [Bacillota bacterium]|nr:hypothetical protein [Bacillota bacterium]
MIKKFILLVLFILLTLPAASMLAGDYPQIALRYIMETYNVPAERIELYQGEMMTLEHLGESFWFAKFTINPEGTGSSGEVQPLPPDTPVSDRGELIEQRPAGDGTIYSGVYINTESGEVLSLQEMEPKMAEDRRLA